jgi:hypothetical protein
LNGDNITAILFVVEDIDNFARTQNIEGCFGFWLKRKV